MSTETTNGAAVAAPAGPTPELVNALLKWPADDRQALARLLADSVRDGFTSLEEAERRDREMIRRRIDDVVSGTAVLLDWRESVDRLEAEFREKYPQ